MMLYVAEIASENPLRPINTLCHSLSSQSDHPVYKTLISSHWLITFFHTLHTHMKLNSAQRFAKAAQINASVPPDETIYMNVRITAPTVMHVHVATPCACCNCIYCNRHELQYHMDTSCWPQHRMRHGTYEKEASRPVGTDDYAP